MEWGFLAQLMLKLGFSNSWVDKIMYCVTSMSLSFLINGEVRGLLFPSRGLRQRDLLFPYLFLICAKGFSSLIHKAISCGDLLGFRCGRTGPIVSHLFFVDDSLLFAKATRKNCITISYIIQDYALASGQVINFDKSAICVSRSVPRTKGLCLAIIVGVQQINCHEKYLGLPSMAGKNKRQLFDSITLVS